MVPSDLNRMTAPIGELEKALKTAKNVLITAPAAADGDSVGAQLALRRMILDHYDCEVHIVNDEPIPFRYQFLPDIEHVMTPEDLDRRGSHPSFEVGVIVDGGIDRAGRVRKMFDSCASTVFIDHHVVSFEYPYSIRLVEPHASSTTELMYYLSRLPLFETKVDSDFAQQIYLGLIFDTGFFRHSNTTPEVMELGAELIRTGFDFTQVGERGMLARTYASLRLLSDTLHRAEVREEGKIIWSSLSQKKMEDFHASLDDREGIIDQLFLTHGIEVALMFFDLGHNQTKISLRSQGPVDVAKFARSLTVHGGGHEKAAGANLDIPMDQAIELVLAKLELVVRKHSS